MFDYFEPATEEDLEYYDAMPCTIFFGIIKTEEGPRVMGFNNHYYPPKIRFKKIFDLKTKEFSQGFLVAENDGRLTPFEFEELKILENHRFKAVSNYICQLES